MRAKHILSRITIPNKVKLVYARLTLNRLTTFYFFMSLAHFILQVVLQLAAHAINVDGRHLVAHILKQARFTMDKFALIENKHFPRTRETDLTLTLCRGIPGQFGLTGKDVCDVLWSQSKGFINDTLEDFLDSSSGSDNRNNESDSDSDDKNKAKTKPSDENKTKPPSSTLVTTTSSVGSSSSAQTFTIAPSTLPFAIAPVTPASTLSTSSTQETSATPITSFSRSSSLVAPSATSTIQPDSGLSPSDESDNDDYRVLQPKQFRSRRGHKQRRANDVAKQEDGRKVFDREKIRPLSLPPKLRSDAPSSIPVEAGADIDATHPDLEAHIQRARVPPVTNSFVARSRQGQNVEFVPVAPRTFESKRIASSRLARSHASIGSKWWKRALYSRTLTMQDRQNVTITPVFSFGSRGDDDMEVASKVEGMGSAVALKSPSEQPKLVSIKVSGLMSHESGSASAMAESGASSNTALFGEVTLSPGCALALSWPAQVLRDFSREDLAMIGFQAWLLGMSIVAILNESVPHLVAGLFTQALSTGWSAFQMVRSSSFKSQYKTVVVRGACSGVDVLPDYFFHRTKDEIPIVVFNGVFLVAMLVVSWRMCKVYGWQTFKRIGASRVMNRAYRLVLAFSINLQVALYFFVTSTVMWVDALLNGPVARFAEHASIYKGVFITSILLLLPWLVLGWIGVRRENKHMMHAFLIISMLFITAWAAMFASDVYRWTFATWPFFAVMTVTSFVVLVSTTGLAIVCRLNFKKGLALFLRSQEILPGTDFTDAIDESEKVGFPTQRSGGELPTFSVAFGQGGNPQPPSQMFPARPPVSKASTLDGGSAIKYSTNPYANGGSDFWGNSVMPTRSASVRTKSSIDTAVRTVREPAIISPEVPRYLLEDSNLPQPSVRRELPQWQEVRRSQVPHWNMANFEPATQTQPRIEPDRASVVSLGTETTGTRMSLVEVLRDGKWQRVDARELYRTSGVPEVAHASRFSGTPSPGNDAGQLAPTPISPAPAYRPTYMQPQPPPVARGFVGLPGRNVKPRGAGDDRPVGGLGGVAVPAGW